MNKLDSYRCQLAAIAICSLLGACGALTDDALDPYCEKDQSEPQQQQVPTKKKTSKNSAPSNTRPRPTCGNGIIDARTEQCDGSDLGGVKCIFGGTLLCSSTCSLDYSGCNSLPTFTTKIKIPKPFCGDGVINSENEECDGIDFNGLTCAEHTDYGLMGLLSCTKECKISTASCLANEPDGEPIMSYNACGNNIVEPKIGEQCDLFNMQGKTCADFGFLKGSLGCSTACKLTFGDCF